MKCLTKKLRSPLKWHGGKSYLARRIIALMPPHTTYVEPFIGGGSILLNKSKVDREIVGDLNADLVNFWVHVDCVFFRTIIGTTKYSAEYFEIAKSSLEIPGDEPQNRAINFLVRNRMSRGGLGKDFAWSDRLRGGQPGDVNAWETIKAELPAIADRIQTVQFNHISAFTLIQVYDGPGTLTYCDPPYLHETRTAKKAYAHEMGRDQHEQLLDVLKACEGAVMLSGYRSSLYDDALADWHRIEFDMPNHSGQGASKQRRIECLWSNRLFMED